MSEENIHSDSENLQSKESQVQDEDYWELEISDEQKRILEEKLASAQKQFQIFNSNQKNQKIADVIRHIKDIDEKTADLAIQSCKGNELLAIKRLMDDEDYKLTVIQMASGEIAVDMDSILYRDKNQEVREALEFDPEDDSEQSEVEEYRVHHKKHHKSEGKKKDDDFSISGYKQTHSVPRGPRLLLDDALIMLANLALPAKEPTEVKEEKVEEKSDHSDEGIIKSKKEIAKSTVEKEKTLFKTLSGSKAKIPEESLRQLGWSEARIKAFQNREKNPNQYYYRFNDPGEPQATGKWSPKDKELFLKLIEEKGVDYQWGIFSKQIPGRVGYQCSNFYRQLIKEGVIKDDNYVKDKDGKLVFLFRDKDGNSTLQRAKRKVTTPQTSKSKRLKTDHVTVIDIPEPEPEVNVLPDYIDPMTMMPVVKPAISPYGHVMGYDSWVKVLNKNPKNTCPFTKKKLTRRSLVKLTIDNIDEYRDKIINVNGFESELQNLQ